MYYNFNKLFIIESLPPGDLRSGFQLYEDLFKWHTENGNRFNVEYLPIKNKEGLDLFFEITLEDYKTSYIRPIIHLESHGCEEGIRLASGEVYNWDEFLNNLSKINFNSKNYLFLVLSLCKGGHILSAIDKYITNWAPFFAVVFSFDTISAGKLLAGFRSFYQEAFDSKNVTSAMDKLSDKIDFEEQKYILMSCLQIFRLAFESYLNEQCSRKMILKRTENLITKLKLDKKNLEINKIRPIIKKDFKKSNQKAFFEMARDQFLLIKAFPENRGRFNLEFSDLKIE